MSVPIKSITNQNHMLYFSYIRGHNVIQIMSIIDFFQNKRLSYGLSFIGSKIIGFNSGIIFLYYFKRYRYEIEHNLFRKIFDMYRRYK